jgi:uncharacterized integral membrane protein
MSAGHRDGNAAVAGTSRAPNSAFSKIKRRIKISGNDDTLSEVASHAGPGRDVMFRSRTNEVAAARPEARIPAVAPPATPAPQPPARDAPPPVASTSAGGRGHSVLGAAWAGIWAAALVAIVLIVFLLQNTGRVRISFLGWHGTPPLTVTLLIAMVAGVVLTLIFGTARITQLRRRMRRSRREDAVAAATRADQAEAPLSG